MRELRQLTHSPHHLMVFEVAARHQSFTTAAGELNVSQPAVSLAIRQLETALGVNLFKRGHRTVTLTEAGEVFYRDVSLGFGRMLETAKLLRRRIKQSHVTLSVSTAFANYWMVPVLTEFRANYPEIDLRLQTTDKDLDLAEEDISLGIRRGDGNWSGYNTELIAPEILFPVASEAFLNRRKPIQDLETLAADRLIHLEEPYRPRPIWNDWFAGVGGRFKDTGAGLRLNDYALVLQAAMAGQGIAMGWSHVTTDLIAQKLLAPVGNWVWETGNGFYLIWSNRTPLSEEAEAVRSWMINLARTKIPVRKV